MKYIEAPREFEGDLSGYRRSVFLAGGITNCPAWQQEMVELLESTNLVLFNPRRKDFPIGDPNAAREQIEWEYRYLRKAASILFWFPKETLCPIVLFELGSWSMTGSPIFVGVHPEYERRQDIEIQMSLVRPTLEIVYDLDDLAKQVIVWAR
jgi:hypothetical protein